MQVGIDSYSYHRRYGESRAGEAPRRHEPWPLVPAPVLRARPGGWAPTTCSSRPATCPSPRRSTPRPCADAGADVRVGFSWGHPWPGGALPRPRRRPVPGAEADLARWIDTAARLGHDVLRITAGSPASRGDEPAEVLVERLVAPIRRAADVRPRARRPRSPSRTTATCGSRTSSSVIERVDRPDDARRHASTTSTSSGSATTWPRGPGRSRRTRCSSSSRTTCAGDPTVLGRPGVHGPGRGRRRSRRAHRDPRRAPASTARCASSSPRWARATSTSWR